MANKNINILLKMTDKFTQPMLKAANATKQQERAFKTAQTKAVSFVNTANNKFLSLTKTIGKAALGLAGLSTAFSVYGLKNFASEAMELAQAQDEAETKLLTLLGNVPSIAEKGNAGIKEAQKNLLGVASNLQKVGIIGDEVTIAGMQQLATFQLSEKSIADLSVGMTDLLAQTKGTAATQEDAVSAANMIGKAMSGQVSALTRVGIIMDDNQKKAIQNGDEAQRAAVLAEVLAQNVGGVNEALAATPEGKIKQAQNAYGDMLEEIGEKLLPLKANLLGFASQYIPAIQNAATAAIDALTPALDALMNYLNEHSEQIKSNLKAIGKFISNLWSMVKPVLAFIIKHSKAIATILAIIGGLFVSLNIAMKIMAIVSAVQAAIGVVTALGAVFTAFGTAAAAAEAVAMAPILPLVLAIGGIIAVLILVVKHWDKIKAVASTVLTTIKGWITSFVDRVVEKVTNVYNSVVNIINKIKEAWEWLTKLSDGTVTASGGMSSSGLVSVGHATGTPYFRGGLTRVNEGGRGEIMNLPNGTQIIPHDVATKTGNTNVTVNFTIAGNVIGNEAYMEEVGNYVGSKVINALGVI